MATDAQVITAMAKIAQELGDIEANEASVVDRLQNQIANLANLQSRNEDVINTINAYPVDGDAHQQNMKAQLAAMVSDFVDVTARLNDKIAAITALD